MRCEDINELLTAYLDEEVTAEERGQIETHLSACQKCQEELRLLATTREGLRHALRARAADVEPSHQAWDAVRQGITSKSSFWEQFSGILNRPVWRAIIPVVLVVVLAVGVLWGTGILPGLQSGKAPVPAPAPTIPAPTVPPPVITIPPPAPITPVPAPTPAPTPPPAPRPAPPPPFQVSVVPEDAHYLPGETVEVKLSFSNISSETISMSPYPPEIRVTPRSNYDQVLFSVAAGTQPLEIKPNETVSVNFTWDQKDRMGRQVQPGWYNVIFGDITVRQGGSRYSFNPGTHVLIQYPQGVMEKSLDLNQSQTVNGITVTLERIELTADGSSLYFFFIPPGYTAPPTGPGLPPMPPPMSIMARAEYSVGGITRNAGTAGFNTKGNGIKLVWAGGPDKLDPVPSDAKELIFTITQLNNWQGPWEFRIPLE